MVMEQPKMSVGLESSALGINLSGPWLPSPSPTLKLNTPTLEALTGGTDWAVPNSSQTSGAQTGSLLSAPPAGVLSSAGLSPRFLFDNRLMSPGVSGSLAGNLQPDAPQAGSASLTELFNCSEYNIVPSPTQLTAQGTQAIVQQAVNPLIQKQISGAAADKTQSGRQTQQQAQSQAKQVQAPSKAEQQKQQAQKPPQPQQQTQPQRVKQQQAQQQAQQTKQAQAQQQRDAIQAQQTKPQQRQSQQQAQLPPASQHLQAQSMSMRSTSLPQSHALRTDAQRAQAASHHAAFQAQSQALGAQQRPAPVPMLPTQARQEEPAHRQYSVYQSFDQQRHQPEMTARASAIPVPQGLHRAQLPVQAMHSQAMPTAMGYSHEMGHTYAQAHTDRLTMQAAHQGQSLGLTHAQLHAPSAPVIPTLGQSRLSGQAAFNLPPRPAATKGPRVELGTSISGAIEEAKVNAQQKANLFAQNRKRVRKEMEQDKKEDADDSKMSQSDIRKKRYNRRLELNRQSAAVSRVRRRAYVEELEEKLVTVEREKIGLEGKVSEMHTENTTLREQLRALTEQISASARAPVPYPSLPRTDTGK